MEGCGFSLMAFGDNNSNSSGLYPMMMIPSVTSNHGHAPAPPYHPINPNLINIPIRNPNPNAHTNNTTCLFPPLPYSCTHSSHANDHHPNPNNSTTPGTSSSMMLHNTNNDTVTGLGYFMEIHPNNNDNDGSSSSSSSSCSAVKAKIMAHPHYHRLLAAYINCQKVGAPSEVVARLEDAYACPVRMAVGSGCMGEDPALDQFMEAYCEMLTKYHQELSKPFNEAILFLQTIESQLKSLAISTSDFGAIKHESNFAASVNDALMKSSSDLIAYWLDIDITKLLVNQYSQVSNHVWAERGIVSPLIEIWSMQGIHLRLRNQLNGGGCKEGSDRNGSPEDDVDVHTNMIDPHAEDRELKGQLLRKYSGCLGSLKQEFMKRRKKGKLPREARQQLLEWWSRHYKWPYPSESQKLALAESTGLDQKQINNWFINQRKRHWKPSEDMQFVAVDPSHPHYYMDNVLSNPFPMDLSHTIL